MVTIAVPGSGGVFSLFPTPDSLRGAVRQVFRAPAVEFNRAEDVRAARAAVELGA
jgi:hypothetical protein